MALAQDIFDIGVKIIKAAETIDRQQKLEVAQHFVNFSTVFMQFPVAHRANDKDRLDFLIAKTGALIGSLKESTVFRDVFGKALGNAFFAQIEAVLNQKELMVTRDKLEARYSVIVATAGALEGYAESLRAQAARP